MSILARYNNLSIVGPVGVEDWYNREEFLDENVKDILVYMCVFGSSARRGFFLTYFSDF